MPLFGIGGSFYWVLAIILGLWLLSIAWQVYKLDGNKIAFKMYRYSSMYLAFIFLALVIDVLI
jgi:protoheme IX farnesyltransferase